MTIRTDARGAGRRQAGQATVEYALLLFLLFIVAAGLRIPGTGQIGTGGQYEGNKSFMQACLDAYRVYTVSHYYVLNLPFP